VNISPATQRETRGKFPHIFPGKRQFSTDEIFTFWIERGKLSSLYKRSCNPRPGSGVNSTLEAENERPCRSLNAFIEENRRHSGIKNYSGQIRWNTPKNWYRWIICGHTARTHTSGLDPECRRSHTLVNYNERGFGSIHLYAAPRYLRILIRNVLHVHRCGLWPARLDNDLIES